MTLPILWNTCETSSDGAVSTVCGGRGSVESYRGLGGIHEKQRMQQVDKNAIDQLKMKLITE